MAMNAHCQPPLLKNIALLEELQFEDGRKYPIGKFFPVTPVSCVAYQNALVDHVITDRNGSPNLVLISFLTMFAGYEMFPNILYRDETGLWSKTQVPKTRDGFRHVHLSRDGQDIALFMWNVPGGTGGQTNIVFSEDGGRHWRYTDTMKHHAYFMATDLVLIDSAGMGTAIEHYKGGTSGYDQVGFHVFHTYDHGRTWSEREYYLQYDVIGMSPPNVNGVIEGAKQRLVDVIDVAYLECEEEKG